MLCAAASGRNTKAAHDTASSRVAMSAVRAGRPTARCGSAPSAMPTPVTATTWNAECRAGTEPTLISQGVGERAGRPDRRRFPVTREVEAEQLAQRDQGREGDRAADGRHPARERLRDAGHDEQPGGHDEQALAVTRTWPARTGPQARGR